MGAEGAQGLAGDTSMKQVKLGDAAKFIRGITFKPDDKVKPFSDGSIVCFRTSNVQSILNEQDLIAVPSKFVKRREQFAQAGDVLVSTANSWELVGKCSWVPDLKYRATIGGFISALRADPETVLPRYLYHWFNSPEIQLKARNCGRQTTNISNMDIKRCQEITIPLPPLEQQKRIAAILDKADELSAKRRRAIAKLDELLKSVFLEMFGDPVTNPKGWPRVPFNELLEGIESGWSPICEDRRAEEDEWGVLKLGAVTYCVYDDSSQKALPSGVEPKPKIEVKQGDVLFSRKNTYNLVAACAYVLKTRPRLMLPDLIFRFKLKANSEISPIYLWALLIQEGKRKQIQVLAGGAAGSMPNISKAKLYGVEIEFASVSLQKKYEQIALNIWDQKEKITANTGKLDTLFASLQARAFSGDLTPDALDEVEAVATGS